VIEQNQLINTRFNYIKRIPHQAVSQNFRSRERKAGAFGFPDISKNKSGEMERDKSNSGSQRSQTFGEERLNNNTIANISDF
jgi:hypothetical protein